MSSFHNLNANERVINRQQTRYQTNVRGEHRFNLHNVKVTGRDRELKALQELLINTSNSISSNSARPRARLVLVSGEAGVGKTSLVEEAYGTKEWYASGKYDQFSRSQPFAAIVGAMKKLIYIVSISEEVDDITADFKEEMGSKNLQHLSQLIPDFGELLELSEATRADPDEQFSLSFLESALRAFLESVTNHIEEGPLVIVIDDLQWSDELDIQLIEFLLADEHLTNTIIVAIYRDGDEGSQVQHFVENLPDETTKIALGGLLAEDIAMVLMDLTKRNDILEVKPLADVILKRTVGNPFFLIECLRDLVDQELICYSLQTFRYEWDVNQIMNRIDVSANLVDLLAARITDITEGESYVLTICACLGTRVSLDDLVIVLCGKDGSLTLDEVEAALGKSEDRGILDRIVLSGKVHYRFSHDRMKKCAYDLFKSESERAAIHWRIGSALLLSENHYKAKPDIFTAVNQLNIAVSLGAKNKFGRVKLARYNLTTAQQARSKYAFVPAARHLRAGIDLLADNSPWTKHYDLMISLMALLAEIEVSIGSNVSARKTIDVSIDNAKSVIDMIQFYRLKVKALVAEKRSKEAVETGLEALALLGMKVKMKVSKLLLLCYLLSLRSRWKKKSDDELLALPNMVDVRALLQSDLISVTIMAAYQAGNEELYMLLVIRQVLMQLKHGIHPSTFYICVWGVVCFAMRDITEARRIARLEARLIQRASNKTTPGAMCMKYFQLHPLNHPIHDSIDPLMAAYNLGFMSGEDPFMSCIAGVSYVELCLFCGSSLQSLETTTRRLLNEMKRYRQSDCYDFTHMLLLFILNLTTTTKRNPLILKDEEFDDSAILSSPGTLRPLLVGTLTYKIVLSIFFRTPLDPVAAQPLLSMSVSKMKLRGLFITWAMYPALAMLTEAKQGRNRRKNLKRACRIMAVFKTSIKNEDVNALVPYNILQAQYLAVQNRATSQEIKDSFDMAIAGARRSGYNHFAGLVNVMAAEYFGDLEDEEWAIHYIKGAMQGYRGWGAKNVIKVLERNFMLRRRSIVEYLRDSQTLSETSGFKESEFVRVHEGEEVLDALEV